MHVWRPERARNEGFIGPQHLPPRQAMHLSHPLPSSSPSPPSQPAVLVLGLGGGTIPEILHRLHPTAHIHVLEIVLGRVPKPRRFTHYKPKHCRLEGWTPRARPSIARPVLGTLRVWRNHTRDPPPPASDRAHPRPPNRPRSRPQTASVHSLQAETLSFRVLDTPRKSVYCPPCP